MKRDILAVIVKYLVIDQDRVEIALEQRARSHSKLIAEIPFVREYSPPADETDANADADAKPDKKMMTKPYPLASAEGLPVSPRPIG